MCELFYFFSAFLKRIFVDSDSKNKKESVKYKGSVTLYFGVRDTKSILYLNELESIHQRFPNQFRYLCARSREQFNIRSGGKLYVQDLIEDDVDFIYDQLNNGGHIYFSGLKKMMFGLHEMFEKTSEERKLPFSELLKHLKCSGQWHSDLY